MTEPPEKPKPGREGKGLAPATRQKVFGLLRQSFRRAIVEGVLTVSPAEHLQIRATTEEQQARKRDEALTPEETDLLLRQAEGHP